MRGVIIATVVFFVGLMVLVWVVSERADPRMLEPPPSLKAW